MVRLNKARIILLTFSTLAITTSKAVAQTLPTQDPEFDKRLFLSRGNPTMFVGTACVPPSFGIVADAQVGGVLWPTLLQVKNFLASFVGGQLCITGGSEPGHTDFGHANGFKVDLGISRISKTNTFDDFLSVFVKQHTTTYLGPDGKGGRKDCRSDGAPWYINSNSIAFAMEFPRPILGTSGYAGPTDCTVRDENGIDLTTPPTGSAYLNSGQCCHW